MAICRRTRAHQSNIRYYTENLAHQRLSMTNSYCEFTLERVPLLSCCEHKKIYKQREQLLYLNIVHWDYLNTVIDIILIKFSQKNNLKTKE